MNNWIDISALEVPCNDSSRHVVEVNWREGEASTIVVRFEDLGKLVEVSFDDDSGIRILDELDLADWWINSTEKELAKSWLFQVNSGGWFAFEATRDDFYTKHRPLETREFLIRVEATVFRYFQVHFHECV